MSALDKVKEAKQRADEAKKSYEASLLAYGDSINKACEALTQNRLTDAKRVLDEMKFSKSGELPRSYEELWLSAIPLRKNWEENDGLDTGRWKLVSEFAPIDACVNMKDFFFRALRYGSSEIITDLLPLYDAANKNNTYSWHYNWSGGTLFTAIDSFKGQEDQLLERLKVVDILVDAGAPATRLDEVMVRINQFATRSKDLELSDRALEAMDKTYIGIMNIQLAEGRTHFLSPENAHMSPPENLTRAHDLFGNAQIDLRGEQEKRPSPRP